MTEELPHIRCYECGKVLADKWVSYQNLLSQGVPINEALTKLGFERYCCRMHMMNPIKVPTKSDRQINFQYQNTENLSVATGPTPVIAPLEALQSETVPGAYTIIPLNPAHSEIELPSVPEVNLAAIPAPGVHIVPEQFGSVIRSYQAW